MLISGDEQSTAEAKKQKKGYYGVGQTKGGGF